MRIIQVVPTYLPATRYGGPIFAVHGLSKALARRGHRVDVYTTNVDGSGVSDVPLNRPVQLDGVNVHYFASALPRLYWSPMMRNMLRVTARSADVVHAHSIFLWPTLAAAREARRAGTAYVISPRGMLVPELIAAKSSLAKRLWISFFEKGNLENAAVVHFTSETERQDAERVGVKVSRSAVIPNGIDVPARVRGERVDGRILYFGRVSWKKRIDLLIDALALLPEATLVVAGNDDEQLLPALQKRASAANVADRIEWRGPAYGDEKERLLASASMLALTSDSENFGNVVLEALAQETPVLLTPGVGLSAAVAEARAGVVMNGSADAIANAARALLSDRELRARMGRAGRELVVQHFTWDAVAAEFEETYRSLHRTTQTT